MDHRSHRTGYASRSTEPLMTRGQKPTNSCICVHLHVVLRMNLVRVCKWVMLRAVTEETLNAQKIPPQTQHEGLKAYTGSVASVRFFATFRVLGIKWLSPESTLF